MFFAFKADCCSFQRRLIQCQLGMQFASICHQVNGFEGMVLMEWFWIVVIAAGSALVEGFFLKRSIKALEGDVVTMSTWLKYMANLMVVAAVALVLYAHYYMVGVDRYGAWALAAVFGGLGLPLAWATKYAFVEVGADFIRYHRGFGKERVIDFEEIVSYKEVIINGISHWRVKAKNGWRVDVPIEKMQAESLRWYVSHYVNKVS